MPTEKAAAAGPKKDDNDDEDEDEVGCVNAFRKGIMLV
jgi:hypothetical protein